jgi:rhamnogalacturonyl hydrolase YesR
LRKRNIILEGKIKSWLETADITAMTPYQQGTLLTALTGLSRAADDGDYAEYVSESVKKLVDENGVKTTGTLDDYRLGNALFAYASVPTVENAIRGLAAALSKEARSHATETCEGIFSERLGDSLKTQPFYMNYETKFGGKEHYNDVSAQFKILCDTSFDSTLHSSEDCLSMAEYAAALIDTMEVMEQPLYEIFDQFKRQFKEAVAVLTSKSCKETTTACLYAYAVLKGCRMKALHTEKYEKAALDALYAVERKAEEDITKFDVTEVSVLIGAYAESLRNREYQDYGRTKGGVLWN